MITDLGTISFGAIMPLVAADLAVFVPRLTAKRNELQAALSVTFVPPSVGVNVNLATSLALQARMALAISAGFQPPSIAAGLNAQLAIAAQIQADMQLAADLSALLLTSGIAYYPYVGASADFGSTIEYATYGGIYGGTGPTQTIYSLVIFSDASGAGGAAIGALFTSSEGLLTLGAILPLLNSALLAVSADFAAQLAASVAFQAQLTAALAYPAFDLSVAASALLAMDAQFSAAMAFAVDPPAVDVHVELNAQLAILLPALALFLQIQGYLSATASLYHYQGPASGLGAAITAVGPTTGSTSGAVIATGSPATWAAMAQLFKTS